MSGWGKEFLIFLNLIKYAAILVAIVCMIAVGMRLIKQIGETHGRASKRPGGRSNDPS